MKSQTNNKHGNKHASRNWKCIRYSAKEELKTKKNKIVHFSLKNIIVINFGILLSNDPRHKFSLWNFSFKKYLPF